MDPKLTDEYYKNFSDEFEDDESAEESSSSPNEQYRNQSKKKIARYSKSKTLVSKNQVAKSHNRKNTTIASNSDKSLIDQMKNKLHINNKGKKREFLTLNISIYTGSIKLRKLLEMINLTVFSV